MHEGKANIPVDISRVECLTVPGYSYGYFKSKIKVSYTPVGERTAYYPDAEITIFPNPATSDFIFVLEGVDFMEEPVEVTLTNLDGAFIASYKKNQNEKINISEIPVGLYQVSFFLPNHQRITKPLIKI